MEKFFFHLLCRFILKNYMLWFPMTARWTAITPSLAFKFGFAPWSASSLTHSKQLDWAASIIVVAPSCALSNTIKFNSKIWCRDEYSPNCYFYLKLINDGGVWSIRSLTTWQLWLWAPQKSGVLPWESCTVLSAPLLSSTSTTDKCPYIIQIFDRCKQ